MGTWNATCAITQLPIEEGERTVLIPLILIPQDYLSRDNMSGSGSSENDSIAKPLGPPLIGDYDGGGGVGETDTKGLKYLETTLSRLVANKKLYKIKSGEPILCTKVPADALMEMVQGNLVAMLPNGRKQWLLNLQKVYDESDNKQGMSHYLPQLKVHPNTLPDTIPHPLACMLVPEKLYNSLIITTGLDDAHEYWDETKNKPIPCKGTRAEQLMADTTLSAKDKKKLKLDTDDLETAIAEAVLGEGDIRPELLMQLQFFATKLALPNATKMIETTFFEPLGAFQALEDAAVKDDTQARERLVGFSLFSTAMDLMRKQWSPQTGAGSTLDLNDETSRALYRRAAQYILDTTEPFESPTPSL